MIYECAVAVDSDREGLSEKIQQLIKSTLEAGKAEVLVTDDWGVKKFAQRTKDAKERGHYLYFIYAAADETLNAELDRKLGLEESVLKRIVLKLGLETKKDEILKAYKNPNHKNDEDLGKIEKEKKMFSKRRSCWFSANKTSPDWKDPSSYAWLVNEFGKISAGRVTGLRPKYQRMATTAIKRGRCMGLISYVSNRTAARIQN